VPEHVTLYPGAQIGEVEIAPDLPIADPLEPGEAAAVGVDYATRAAGPTRRRALPRRPVDPGKDPQSEVA
jgi:hypothetical protein